VANDVGGDGERTHRSMSEVSVALRCTHRIHFFEVVDERRACGLVEEPSLTGLKGRDVGSGDIC
jgi:hypothetical protein